MKFLLTLFISCICLSSLKTQQMDTEAHRGGRGLMPENTIPAMLNGLKIGVHTLELDCYITADGQVMVSHDPYIGSNIMLNPDGSEITKAQQKKYILYKMPYDSIRLFPEGVKRHADFPEQQTVKTYKPLLAELLDSVEHYVKAHHLKPVEYNIETKSKPGFDGILQPEPEVFVKKLMAVIDQKHVTKRVIIQSFDPRTLWVLHKERPEVRTSWLISDGDYDSSISKLGFTPAILSPAYKIVTADMVKKAHANNVKVVPWTPETPEGFKALADLGVDGIISDYPDRLVKMFGSYQTK